MQYDMTPFALRFVTLSKQAIITGAQLLAVACNLPSSSHSSHAEHLLRSALKTDELAAANVGVCSFDVAFLSLLREQTMRDLTGLKTLRVACDHQLRKLQRALELLKVLKVAASADSSGTQVDVHVQSVGAHSFPEVSVTDKLSQTALGLILTMVMPVPGSVEVGVASIGALWLQGDSAGKHLVVEHPKSDQLNPLNPFTRFRQQAPRNTERLLKSWAAPGEDSTMLLVACLASCNKVIPAANGFELFESGCWVMYLGQIWACLDPWSQWSRQVHNAASRIITAAGMK